MQATSVVPRQRRQEGEGIQDRWLVAGQQSFVPEMIQEPSKLNDLQRGQTT